MINEDSYTQALMKLGLTFLQSKIYLTLARVEKADVKIIAKYSNVARPDVYRVISALEKIGLVLKIIDNPTKYEAIPLKEGYSILLEKRDRKHQELKNEICKLFKNAPKVKAALSEDEQFVLISSKTLFQKKCLIEDNKVQTNIDVIGDQIAGAWFYRHNQVFREALNRGVRIRIVTGKNDYEQMVKIKGMFSDKPLAFDIRYVDSTPVNAVLYDGKKGWLCIHPPCENTFPIPVLFSGNPQFIELLTIYFEKMWNDAQYLFVHAKKQSHEPIVIH